MAEVQRLLVLAGAVLADSTELPSSVRALIDAAEEVFVLTPALTTRLEWVVSDVDAANQAADERLNTVLGHLGAMDVEAEGAVGDDSPLDAVDDHIRSFRPDHILIALRSEEHAGWQERELFDRIEQRTAAPVTVFVIDASGRVVDGS